MGRRSLIKGAVITVLLVMLPFSSLLCQEQKTEEPAAHKNAVTIGFLQGGGSFVGVDYESLLFGRFGIQVGVGYLGFGAGMNIHFRPTVRSSFISFVFWNQGLLNDLLSQRIVGATYVYRGKRGFTAQIGAGYVVKRGDEAEEYMKDFFNTDTLPSIILLYSIGGYFSF